MSICETCEREMTKNEIILSLSDNGYQICEDCADEESFYEPCCAAPTTSGNSFMHEYDCVYS